MFWEFPNQQSLMDLMDVPSDLQRRRGPGAEEESKRRQAADQGAVAKEVRRRWVLGFVSDVLFFLTFASFQDLKHFFFVRVS